MQRPESDHPLPILENSAYHIVGTRLLEESKAGPIYRIPLEETAYRPQPVDHPLLKRIALSRHHRRQLDVKLNWNSRKGRPEIGKPNSAFLVVFPEILVVDHLQEYPDFERPGSPKLHELLLAKVNYTQALCILSGHLAPLVEPPQNHRYLLSLDRFSGENAYQAMQEDHKALMHQLYNSGIIPVTGDAFPIRP